MIRSLFIVCAAVAISTALALAQSALVEPNAGTWKTWVISSGKDFRVPPPPGSSSPWKGCGWNKRGLRLLDKLAGLFWICAYRLG